MKTTPKPRHWTPLEPSAMKPPTEAVIAYVMDRESVDHAKAVAMLDAEFRESTFFLNRLYQVEVRLHENKMVHLCIRRRDGGAIHDWRHLQTIKNELGGPEGEAIELYPAESRLWDASNKYHLWAIADPEWRFPIGWHNRDVQDGSLKNKTPGFRQRPF